MHDRIKPIIDSTYPALMAGLCLTFLAISQIQSTVLVILVSTASFLFILSSFYMLVHSVIIAWGKKPDENKPSKDDKSLSWKITKWTFFFGIILLLLSTFVVVYDLWLHEFLQSVIFNFSGLSNIYNLRNSTNLTMVNQT